jgi:hypothetical protein
LTTRELLQRASLSAESFQVPAYLAYNPNLEILIGVLAVIGLIFPGACSVVALVTTLAAHEA